MMAQCHAPISGRNPVKTPQRSLIHLTLDNLPEERLLADFEKTYRKASDRLGWAKPIGYLSLFLGVAFLWVGGGSFVLVITGLMILTLGGLTKNDTQSFFEAHYEIVLDRAPPAGHELFYRYVGDDRMAFHVKAPAAEQQASAAPAPALPADAEAGERAPASGGSARRSPD